MLNFAFSLFFCHCMEGFLDSQRAHLSVDGPCSKMAEISFKDSQRHAGCLFTLISSNSASQQRIIMLKEKIQPFETSTEESPSKYFTFKALQ